MGSNMDDVSELAFEFEFKYLPPSMTRTMPTT